MNHIGNRMLTFNIGISLAQATIAVMTVFYFATSAITDNKVALSVLMVAAVTSILVTGAALFITASNIKTSGTVTENRDEEAIFNYLGIVNGLGVIALVFLGAGYYHIGASNETVLSAGIWFTLLLILALCFAYEAAKEAREYGAWEPFWILALYGAPTIVGATLGLIAKRYLLSRRANSM